MKCSRLPVGVLIIGDLGIFAFRFFVILYIFMFTAMMAMMANTRKQAHPNMTHGHICSVSSEGKTAEKLVPPFRKAQKFRNIEGRVASYFFGRDKLVLHT